MNSDCTLVQLAERDLRSLAIKVNCKDVHRAVFKLKETIQLAAGHLRNPFACVGKRLSSHEHVAFSSFSSPLGSAKGIRHKKPSYHAARDLSQAEFVLEGASSVSWRQHRGDRPHVRAIATAFLREDDAEDDHEDEDEDELDEDEDAASQFIRNWPVRAEPVTEDDEQHQFDTITAGNVPTLFLGHAYTNGAVNIMAMKKMQSMLEAMFYHLTLSSPNAESRSTVELLLRTSPPNAQRLAHCKALILIHLDPCLSSLPPVVNVCTAGRMTVDTHLILTDSAALLRLEHQSVVHACASAATLDARQMQACAGCRIRKRRGPAERASTRTCLQRCSTAAWSSTPTISP